MFNESLQVRAVELGKYFVVETQEQERLPDYVRRVRNEKGFSLSKVEKNSGGEIDASYVNRIENDLIRNVTPEKLSALAKGLEVSEDEIFAVARGKSLEPMTPTDFYTALQAMGVEQFQAYGGVESLTDEDRREIIAVIGTMIEQKLLRRQGGRKATSKAKK